MPRRAHDMITWSQPWAKLISWNSTSQKNGKTEKAEWYENVCEASIKIDSACCQVRGLAGSRQLGEWRVSSPSHFERWRFRADLEEDMPWRRQQQTL
jgi:hypothetical protein